MEGEKGDGEELREGEVEEGEGAKERGSCRLGWELFG